MRRPPSSAKNRKGRGLGNRRSRQPVNHWNGPVTKFQAGSPKRSCAQFSLKMSEEVMVCTTGLKLMLANVVVPVSGRVLFS